MSFKRFRPQRRDERGAALILAIAFMVIIGATAGATLAMVTSGLHNRRTLDTVRDREYAADAAIEYAIAAVRALPEPGPALMPCGPFVFSVPPNNTSMHVDCTPVPTRTFTGFLQLNVIFTACVGSISVTCGGSGPPPIVRAQVNFQATSSSSLVIVKRTWVQSWSVNG
jgi:hypothetical protein